jgi:5-methylcytosine-specific restriction enzyme A
MIRGQMALLDDLRPTGQNRVIDLVQAAGIDVSDWGNFKRGPKFAAVNPRYCYNWSFVSGSIVVLNLWHRNVDEHRGTVSCTTNLRRVAADLKQQKSKATWIRRATQLDEAIALAFGNSLRVRVIINDGEIRTDTARNAKPSVVHGRMLDPLPWTVTKYSDKTGEALLVRGLPSTETVDQFDVGLAEEGPTERVDVHGMAYVRDSAVRAAALARAAGRCEYCRRPGFVMPSGRLFLETHHILPLSAGGPDTVGNVAALCPNHHREAHFGVSADSIRDYLLAEVKKSRRRTV